MLASNAFVAIELGYKKKCNLLLSTLQWCRTELKVQRRFICLVSMYIETKLRKRVEDETLLYDGRASG